KEIDLRLGELMTPLLPEVTPRHRPPWAGDEDGPNRPPPVPPPRRPPPDRPPPEWPPPDRPPLESLRPGPPPRAPRHFEVNQSTADSMMMGASDAPDRHPIIFDQISRAGCYYVVWASDGHRVAHSSGAPSDVPSPQGKDPHPMLGYRTRGEFREFYHQVPG